MSKFLRTAALVVGGIALAATGFGAVVDATVGLAGAATIGTVAASTVAEAAAVASAGLGILAQVTAKKPKPIGNPMQWQSDPQAGIPIVIGRAYSGGKIVYRQGWGKNNKWETIHTVHSIGPVQSFEQLYVDGVATSVSGDTTVNIASRGYMFERHQIGAQPESAALQVGQGGYPPGIGVTSKLSGLAASAIQLVYDTKGKTTLTTEPQCGYVVQGVRVYDPRKDSTYPGGSGPQRVNDETTWSYAGKDNPYLAALAWVIGWRQNGKLIAGVGAPISLILLDQYVEGANVADANGWKCGGILDTTDDKWQRLKDILLAGGGEPMRLGAQLGCLINTPRVSLATIGVNDVIGDASVQATQSMRDRINAVVPRFMAESSIITSDSSGNLVTTVTWGMAAAGPVIVSDYVTFDGRQRQTQIDFEFVQGPGGGATAPNQVAQLARYAIENAREFGPITLPLKLRWMGYKPGDVVTVTLPELGLNGQDILLLNRSLDPSKGAVTMTARSETYAKHAFALGQTTTAPATPSVSGPPLIPTPDPADWAITATSYTANGQTLPALVVTGDPDVIADAVIFEYRQYTGTQGIDDDWQTAGIVSLHVNVMPITNLIGGIQYQVSIRYRWGPGAGARLILGPQTPALPAGLGGPGSWTILNRENMSIVGSTVSKTGGVNNWGDASVVSAESYVGGASCSFQPAQIDAKLMIGLNTDPATDDGPNTIDFAWHINSDGTCSPSEAGVDVGPTSTYAAADKFQVVYNSPTVSYVQNGTVRYSHAAAANLQLWLDSAFNTIGGKATNLTFAGTGAKGDQGLPGAGGAPGSPGLNSTTVLIYQRSASAPSVPSATTTYTFATSALTGLNNGWSTSIPTGSNPLYVSVATASSTASTDTIAANEWATPVILAQNGTNGLNVASVYLYQRSASAPSVPSASATYTFSTGAISGLNNGWSRTVPADNGQPLWVTTATASATGATDTIASGEWAAPSILSQTLFSWTAYSDSADGTVNFTTGSPDGRSYQGLANNKSTQTESTNPADYQWSSYRGPASFGLVAQANVAIGPDYIIKTGGANGTWDAGAYSSESWQGGCQLSFKVAQNNCSLDVGLNTDPATNTNWGSIDYAWGIQSNGTCRIDEGGVTVAVGPWPYAASDMFQIAYDNKTVRYMQNGTVRYTRAASSGLTLFMDAAFQSSGGRVEKIAFGAAGASGADGISPVLVSVASAVTVTCDAGGTPKGGQLPISLPVQIMQGGVDVTSSAAVTVTASSGTTASYSTGVLTISAVADGGTVTLVATSGSVSGRATTNVKKALDAPPSAQVSGAWNGAITTSYPAAGQIGIITLPATSTGTIGVSWTTAYNTNASGGAAANVIAKAQYRAQGSGTWIDVPSSETTGQSAFGADTGAHEPASPGYNSKSLNLTGLTNGQNYEFQLVAYRNGAGTLSISGSMLLANH